MADWQTPSGVGPEMIAYMKRTYGEQYRSELVAQKGKAYVAQLSAPMCTWPDYKPKKVDRQPPRLSYVCGQCEKTFAILTRADHLRTFCPDCADERVKARQRAFCEKMARRLTKTE